MERQTQRQGPRRLTRTLKTAQRVTETPENSKLPEEGNNPETGS